MFAAPGGPCYRCLHPEPPPAGLVPSCAEAGVLGVLPGIIGTIQATEALKLILGIGDPLIGRFLVYDALKMRFRELKLPKDPDCPVCGAIRRSRRCASRARGPCERDGGQVALSEMTVTDLKASIDAGPRPSSSTCASRRKRPSAASAGSRLIPLGELPRRLGELDPSAEIVVHCKSGGAQRAGGGAAARKGFTRASNLTGGILSWINEIDPSLAALLRA